MMKKSAVAAGMVAFGLFCGAIGAGASTGLESIKAALNHNVSFSLDGQTWKPDNAPITYNNTTYIALRDAAEVLGVGIGWDQASQQIKISSDGTSTENSSNTGNASSSGSAANSGSSSSSSSSASTTSVVTFPVGTTESAAAEQLKETALKAMVAYGKSLAAGNTTAFDEFVNKYVDDQKLSSISSGRAYSRDYFGEKLPDMLDANSESTVTNYSNAIRNASVNDLEIDSTYLGSYSSSFHYTFTPSGWSLASYVGVHLNFVPSDDEKNWVLSYVTIY